MKNTNLEKLLGNTTLKSKARIVTALILFGFLLYEVGYAIGRLLFHLLN